MRKILIAPDSFKGTLSSKEVCDTVAQQLKKNYPDVSVKSIPVADGGEGTSEALEYALGGERVYCNVTSPLGRTVEAYCLFTDGKTAVIESALASGLTLEEEKNALFASSFGTGQMIKAALDKGATKIIIGIGGSAMTDGGTGCLSALGVRFYGEEGKTERPCGENLCRIKKIDVSGLDKRICGTEITVLCDVKNPLYGEKGAAYIFASQKGAGEKDVMLLDEGLRNLADISKECLGADYSFCEGSGAAGGLGFALMGFLKAEMKSGIDCVLDLCEFEKEVQSADVIITGEGKLDRQSLSGKVPFGVASRCKGKRVIALTGVSELTGEEAAGCGINEIIETNPLHLPFDEIKHCAKAMLCEAADKIKL